MTGSRKNTSAYSGIEPGLSEANDRIIRWNGHDTHETKIRIEKMVKKIVAAMKKQSPKVFAKLYVRIFGGGSSYEGLKVGEPNEFDMDILFKIPEETKPKLKESTIRGYVQLELTRFENLAKTGPELHRAMSRFVDEKNYLLTTEFKSFMQSIFDKTFNEHFSQGVITAGQDAFKVSRVEKFQKKGPAATLSIENFDFPVTLDLVPCFLLPKKHWPKNGYRRNPYKNPGEFFIVPKQPKRERPHLERYWRLSFQIQERNIIFDRYWMKPTIRIIKRIRDNCDRRDESQGHNVSSYAIKTLCMRELLKGNPDLNKNTPALWKNSFSYCLVYMLRRYKECLKEKRISYFWNNKLNLLDNLSDEQIESCQRDIERLLIDIESDPSPETVLRYLE